MEKCMSLTTKCKECKNDFKIYGSTLKYQEPFTTKDGEELFLTYVDCPYCGSRIFVQIDTKESIAKCIDVKKQFKQMAKRKVNDKNVSKNKQELFKSARADLTDFRKKLKDCFNGVDVQDKDGNVFKLEVENEQNNL